MFYALQFGAGSDGIYHVEAAATDHTGAVQPFEGVGTIVVGPAAVCPGDCNNDATVGIDDLVLGVNIALGRSSVAECLAFDMASDGAVAVSELVAAVGAALSGCAA